METALLIIIAVLLAASYGLNLFTTIRMETRLAEVRAREAAYDQQALDAEYRSNLEGGK